MAYTVEFLRSAAKQLSAIPKDAQRQISKRIDALPENPRPPGVRPLRGAEGLYRLRVGRYRVIYSIEEKRLVVLVIRISHRRDVYRGL